MRENGEIKTFRYPLRKRIFWGVLFGVFLALMPLFALDLLLDTIRLIRYKVKPEKAAENRSYIEKVFQELKASSPDGLRYASFVLDDGVSFVHLASIESSDGHNPLSETAAFQAEIRDRCEEGPVAVTLEEIGSYRMLGA